MITSRWAGFNLYWVAALMWLVPDRRIERVILVQAHGSSASPCP